MHSGNVLARQHLVPGTELRVVESEMDVEGGSLLHESPAKALNGFLGASVSLLIWLPL